MALPFSLAKRSQLPCPKPGQTEYAFFKELTGRHWHDDITTSWDQETKITEFDWENYLPKEVLKNIDTQSDQFKNFVRALNFVEKTRYELHKE